MVGGGCWCSFVGGGEEKNIGREKEEAIGNAK